MKEGKRTRLPMAEHPTASEALDFLRRTSQPQVRWAQREGDWWEIVELEEE